MARTQLRKINQYSEEFKATAVALSQMEGVAVQDVAAELDLHPFMLSLWRRQVPGRPVEHLLLQRAKDVPEAGIDLRLNQWTVVDERSGKLLAQVNDYLFVSRITALMDMSGHGGNADEKCMKGSTYGESVNTLATRVLGDTNGAQ